MEVTQPAPVKTDTPEVWPLVIADVKAGKYEPALPLYWVDRIATEMQARHDFGRAKYGVGLQVENGRDPLRDALDEALDMSCYTRQQFEKTGRGDDWETHRLAVLMVSRLMWRMKLREEEGT